MYQITVNVWSPFLSDTTVKPCAPPGILISLKNGAVVATAPAGCLRNWSAYNHEIAATSADPGLSACVDMSHVVAPAGTGKTLDVNAPFVC